MGGKLLWTGLTLIVAVSEFVPSLPIKIVGAVIMTIGLVLYLIDR